MGNALVWDGAFPCFQAAMRNAMYFFFILRYYLD